MKHKDCLSDQNLILHFYGEFADNSEQKQHLASCHLCAERLSSLSHDLARLSSLEHKPDHFAESRIAARVSERLRHPKRNQLIPTIGVTAAAAMVMVMTFILLPQPQVDQVAQAVPSSIANMDIEDSMPDIDFLEDLELLQELELLAQIEGV